MVINQSGRGDKDIFTVADAIGDAKWREFIQEKARWLPLSLSVPAQGARRKSRSC